MWASEASGTTKRGKAGIFLMVVNILGVAISCWMTCESFDTRLSIGLTNHTQMAAVSL